MFTIYVSNIVEFSVYVSKIVDVHTLRLQDSIDVHRLPLQDSRCVAMGRDLDESTVAHSDTIINWPIKSDFENDIQEGITMNV